MKLLYITHGTWLDMDTIAAGNSVRGYWLARGLAEQGVEVVFAHPAALGAVRQAQPLPGVTVETYTDDVDLGRLIRRTSPDALLVGYWELLAHLPQPLSIPVIADLVAPRVLEVMYEDSSRLSGEIERMLQLYRRADRFLVGNRRQRHFLLPWLMMAGFDLRAGIPVDVVPISTEASAPKSEKPDDTHWRFVSGGVNWPWRRSAPYFDALAHALERLPADIDGSLHLFAGNYVYGGGSSDAEDLGASARITREPLLPYGAMRRYFRDNADIGVELAEHNVEREFSQAFRAVESLGAGLPVLISGYTELAEHVRAYDAGWCVDEPAQLTDVVRDIVTDRETWARKSANAVRLVADILDYRVTVRPLLAYLQHPGKPLRDLPRLPQPRAAATPAPPPRRAARLKSRLLRLARGTLRRLPRRGERAIVMVTRSDFIPTDHGAAVKIDRTAWGLSLTGIDVLVVTDERRRYYRYRAGRRETLPVPVWLRLALPLRWVRKRLIARGVPGDEAFFYYPLADASFILRVLYLGLRHRVLAYQAEFPAYARPALWGRSLLGGKVLVVEHNVEYQRLADQFPDTAPAAKAYLHDVEVALCSQADAVIAVSERDRDTLAQAGVPAAQVFYVPHGVDLAAFDDGAAEDVRGRFGIAADRPILVYHGIYAYPPNREAMVVMAQEILPRLNALGLYPIVLAVGRNPPAETLHPDILFTGSVDRVAPWLRAADIAVVPLQQGGGTRMKILDYFAATLPVVSTAKGIEGIPVTPGRDAEVHDDFDAFTDAIARLLADPAAAAKMAGHGRAIVDALDWRQIALRYRDILGI